MAKAVLVMDMPENCFKCKLQDFSYCRIAYNRHVGEGRPDWCPLRELPDCGQCTLIVEHSVCLE